MSKNFTTPRRDRSGAPWADGPLPGETGDDFLSSFDVNSVEQPRTPLYDEIMNISVLCSLYSSTKSSRDRKYFFDAIQKSASSALKLVSA